MSVQVGRFQAVRWAAISMAAVEIGIHAYLAPSHLAEKPYIGVLFVVADVLLAGVLVSLLTGLVRPVGWLLGVGVCAGMFVGLVLSRTTGLPGYHEAWSSDHWLGVASLPPELVFVACAAYAARFGRAPAAETRLVEVYGGPVALSHRSDPGGKIYGQHPVRRTTGHVAKSVGAENPVSDVTATTRRRALGACNTRRSHRALRQRPPAGRS